MVLDIGSIDFDSSSRRLGDDSLGCVLHKWVQKRLNQSRSMSYENKLDSSRDLAQSSHDSKHEQMCLVRKLRSLNLVHILESKKYWTVIGFLKLRILRWDTIY